MTMPSSQDFLKPFDPTFIDITSPQLTTLFDGLMPNGDKGIIIATRDVSGTPQVPDASLTTKWKNYLWLRDTGTSKVLYQWSDYAALNPTLLRWQPVFQLALPPLSVGPDQLQPNSVNDINIVSMDYSKLINAPASLPPSGAAGGSLGGNYPNPTLNPPDNSILPVKITIPGGNPGYPLMINDAGDAPVFQKAGVIQAAFCTIAGLRTAAAVVTDGNPTVVQGTQIGLVAAFTPKSGASLIRIRLTGQMYPGNVNAHTANYGLFVGNTLMQLTQLQFGGPVYPQGASSLEAVVVSWGAGVAKDVQVRMGTTTDGTNLAQFNHANGLGFFSVEEIFSPVAIYALP